MTEAARDPALQALLDKQALHELALRYARAIDRRDRALLLSVYHDDAVDRHGSLFEGSPRAYADWQPEVMAPFEVTAHYIMNTDFRLDGDHAQGELYFVAFHRRQPPEREELLVGGRYLDRYERRDGEWKISDRQLVWDFVSGHLPQAAHLDMLASLGTVGSGADDASYRVLPLFRST